MSGAWRLDRPEHEPRFFATESAAVVWALIHDPKARRVIWWDAAAYEVGA